ncbi:MAG: DUF3783 domain-containing protein [Nanoarchaeota archaeon]
MPKQKSDFRELKKGKKEEKHKVIILNGFSDSQLNSFIDFYKKSNLPKAIFATVTKISKEFKVKDLLKELKKERRMMKKNVRSKNS